MIRPKLTMMHGNAKCSGCAVNFELCPATEEHKGYVVMRMAKQNAVSPALFDCDNAACVRLRFEAVCKMLQVLRGEVESIADGSGILIRESGCPTMLLRFSHIIEPYCGYEILLMQKWDGGEMNEWRFVLTGWESLGLCEALQGAIPLLAFGVPSMLLGDTRGEVVATDGNGCVTAQEVL